MKIYFPESYRSRLNNYQLTAKGEYDSSEFPKEYVDYCLKHGKCVSVDNTPGANPGTEDVEFTSQALDDLRAEYEALADEPADKRWGASRLEDEIEKVRYELGELSN